MKSQNFALAFVAILLSSCESSTSPKSSQTVDTSAIPWNAAITYGSLDDARDGQSYKTVKIGAHTWMAQNLNYSVDSSWCYGGSSDSCAKYGRLYQWAAAMDLPSVDDTITWGGNSSTHQGICPTGWRIPTDSEWMELWDTTGNSYAVSHALRSMKGWNNGYNGTDSIGFRVLPSGYRDGGTFLYSGSITGFWSATETGPSIAAYISLASDDHIQSLPGLKQTAYSLRCIKN